MNGRFFVVADDSDYVLPPVDVIDKRRRAERARITTGVDNDLKR